MAISFVFCSCAIDRSATRHLPAEVSSNPGAGRGDRVHVPLRLKHNEGLLFIVDTGMPYTVLDNSLESMLGKCVYTNQVRYEWFPAQTEHVYRAPELFLENTRLISGDWIRTTDLSRLLPGKKNEDRPVVGLLGMDCLHHYCIQLDFAERKMRFLDPFHLKSNELGAVFPLTWSKFDRLRIGETLLGDKATTWVDTGDPNDGHLMPKLFEQEVENHKGTLTNQFKAPTGSLIRVAMFPNGVFAGQTYTNLIVGQCPDENIIGLRFLARHVVTINFPRRLMYLKRQREGPLDPEPNR